jgi:hypothetical protein
MAAMCFSVVAATFYCNWQMLNKGPKEPSFAADDRILM